MTKDEGDPPGGQALSDGWGGGRHPHGFILARFRNGNCVLVFVFFEEGGLLAKSKRCPDVVDVHIAAGKVGLTGPQRSSLPFELAKLVRRLRSVACDRAVSVKSPPL